VLDVPLFGRPKSTKEYLARHDNLDPHMDHTFHVFRAYEIAATRTTTRSSWEKARFGSVRCDETYHLWVDERRIRASPKFVEVWQVNYAEERLLQRRRRQKLGFLNQDLPRIEAINMGPHIDFIQ
jgi:hypothetical protein